MIYQKGMRQTNVRHFQLFQSGSAIVRVGYYGLLYRKQHSSPTRQEQPCISCEGQMKSHYELKEELFHLSDKHDKQTGIWNRVGSAECVLTTS